MRQALGLGALGRPRGIGWRGRWEGGLGWGTRVNPWLFQKKKNPPAKKKKNSEAQLQIQVLGLFIVHCPTIGAK